jgi:O-acetyl-ADP-ribose deacetylase (regulator of RNase III)
MDIILAAANEDLAQAWEQFCGDLAGVRVYRGSILDLRCDAIVSPANSFGFMDGGIDAAYTTRFGPILQRRLQEAIRLHHHGELLVGSAEMIETGSLQIPYLIAAPTMRVPMILRDSVNPYLATRAVFLLIQQGRFREGERTGQAISDVIQTVAFPGLGTGVGQIGPNTCAHQMRAAMNDFLLGQWQPPRSSPEASEQHQLLYTDKPRRLQQK